MTNIVAPVRARPPGEGERRAIRGYGRQYEASASLIYSELSRGELGWVGLADRRAGVLDDLVLGLSGHIVGHQFKSSQYPEAFRIRGLLLGSEGMLSRLAAAWTLLCKQFAADDIEIRFVTTDFPSVNDILVANSIGPVHSAAFVAELRAEGGTRTLDSWRGSKWWPLIDEMRAAAGLNEPSFEAFLRALRVICENETAVLRGDLMPPSDRALVREIADILPRLIQTEPQRDRWTREELFQALNWSDAMGQRRVHQFRVGTYVQRNRITETALRRAINDNDRGYVTLLGPPGTGKSTLLQTGLLPAPETVIIRYLAFVPGEAQGVGRAEAEDFLSDVIAQLKRSGLRGLRYRDADLLQKREQFEHLMAETACRFAERQIRTVLILDGLDHISREERPVRSLLLELPLPDAIPAGLTIVLGTQHLDLDDLSVGIRAQAAEASRCVHMEPLSREAIHRLADAVRVPADVDRDRIYEIAEGHPLATHYLTEALRVAANSGARRALLTGEFTYGGDVERVYSSAWAKIENDPDSRRVLAYVARADGPIHPNLIATIIREDAVERAYRSTRHLLATDAQGRWRLSITASVFICFASGRLGSV
jgi:AAA ATPase domain